MQSWQWLEENYTPDYCFSDQLIYEDMASQSSYSLPLIYQPLDPGKISHWTDRGLILDFLLTTKAQDKTILDFGPGDGWPALPLASFARQVIGLDSSLRRVETCIINGRRLGLKNADFKWYDPAGEIPFDSCFFDGITAASSIEQTPSPRKTLQELFRILKPGGRMRICYEALGSYRGGGELDYFIMEIRPGRSKIILYNRLIEKEEVLQYGITVALPQQELEDMLEQGGTERPLEKIPPEFMEKIRGEIINVQKCRTFHPSGKTFLRWLMEIGFRQVRMTHTGKEAAREVFLQLPQGEIPQKLEQMDRLLRPPVGEIVNIPVAPVTDSMITAIK